MNKKMKATFQAMLRIDDSDLDTMTAEEYERFECYCRCAEREHRKRTGYLKAKNAQQPAGDLARN
jgi:hypothetical protein